MKNKLLLFLILISFIGYGQGNPSRFANGVQITGGQPTVSTVNYLTTTDLTGLQGKILPENVSLTIIPPPLNYAPTTSDIKGHLNGIDIKLGQIGNTTAGITNRIYFTGDNTTVNSVVYFASSGSGKGATASGTPAQSVSVNDNQRIYFTKDVISIAQPSATTAPPGTFVGQLTVETDANNDRQKFGFEVYKTNNLGVPIASGITGAPVGTLGVTIVALLDSGEINLVPNSITNVTVTGTLASTLSLNVGERLLYHVFAEKVGTIGGAMQMQVHYGTNYNSYYDVPVTPKASTVINDSGTVAGLTVAAGMDNLNSSKENISNKQNSLVADGSGVKYPTVDAINNVIVNEITGNFSNIQTLINSNPPGTTINLKPGTVYLQQSNLLMKEGITINGNGATLKRDAQITTTTTVSANQTSTTLTVTSIPSNLAIGDRLSIYTDDTAGTSSQPAIITNIVGNVITLKSALAHSNLPTYTWPIGSTVRKDYDQISTPYNVSDVPIPTTYIVRNLIFDGNKANNAGSFYWAVNTAVFNNGKSLIDKCTFLNMPNETIMGGGMTIKNCYAQDINGSFVHQSIDQTVGESILGGEISGNTVKNSNIKASPSITGHSEGVIAFSFTSGRCSINNNRFLGGNNQAVLGHIQTSSNSIDGSNKNFIFTNNYCENFAKVVDNFTYNITGLVASPDNIYIMDNIFSNCGVDDWSTYATSINNMGVVKFTGNLLTNGTTISNIPEKMKTGYLLAGGTVNNIPKYDANGYLTSGSITDNGTNVVYTRPIFKTASSNGTTAVPVWDKNIFSGLLGSHESGIEFGNTLTNNNGTMVRIRVNDINNANTPLYPMYFNSDGTVTASSLSGTGMRTVVADASGNLSATSTPPDSRPYKVYSAYFTQSGTTAPTITVLENTLGGTPAGNRSVAGSYTLTLSSAFTANKTFILSNYNVAYNAEVKTSWQDGSNILIGTYNTSGTQADGVATSPQYIEVRVYP